MNIHEGNILYNFYKYTSERKFMIISFLKYIVRKQYISLNLLSIQHWVNLINNERKGQL